MAEIVGVDHVSIGTDQHVDAGERAGLHAMGAPRRGDAARRLHPEETGKIAGGNYMRIFRAAVG